MLSVEGVNAPFTESTLVPVLKRLTSPNEIPPCAVVPCASERSDEGDEDPIPTLPLAKIVKSVVPVEEAMVRGLTVVVPCTKSVAACVVVPTPTVPEAVIVTRVRPLVSILRALASLVPRSAVFPNELPPCTKALRDAAIVDVDVH